MSLKGKITIVTGASHGISTGIAFNLIKQGAKVLHILHLYNNIANSHYSLP